MKLLKSLEALKHKMTEENNNGILVLNNPNLTYLTGISGSSALLVLKDKNCIIFSHDVNYDFVKTHSKDLFVERVEPNENIFNKIVKKAKTLKIKNLTLDSATVEIWNNLSKDLGKNIKLKVDKSSIQDLRKIKSDKEVNQIKKAAKATIKGMQVATETITPGIKESEVIAEIEYAIKKQGCFRNAFETIVASGKGSAFPHGNVSDKKISKGDIVIVDVGVKYNFYCSDMTRTFVAGIPSEKQKKIFQIVTNAQIKAMESIKEGINASYVDSVARKVIEKDGYGEYFVHSLGHGVGLEVHEKPFLSSKSKDKLASGNVVTVEPGIYLMNYGGVRIEDTVLVKKDGIEKLTDGIRNFRAEKN